MNSKNDAELKRWDINYLIFFSYYYKIITCVEVLCKKRYNFISKNRYSIGGNMGRKKDNEIEKE